jgi:signal transduction histidine kinase
VIRLEQVSSIRRLAWNAEDIVEDCPDGVFVVSSGGFVLSWNPAMEQITGLPRDAVIGCSWAQVFGPAGGEPRREGEFHYCRPDGAGRWIRFGSGPMRGGAPRAGDRVVVARDVTEEVDADQTRSDRMAALAHELRARLTPLKGFLTMIAEGRIDPAGEDGDEMFAIMLRQTAGLERLVADLQQAALTSEPAFKRVIVVEDSTDEA